MTPSDLHQSIQAIATAIGDKPLNKDLSDWLNANHGVGTPTFEGLRDICKAGVAAGWLCNREHGGIKFGRIFKPEAALNGFSVDVVDMTDVVGPQHAHPTGEIDLIMPMDGSDALFDGQPAGWWVYPAGSVHKPTVSQGRALVLYLLPQGAIDFNA